MDMAVANLFKHKIRFELRYQGAGIEEPTLFMTYRYYRSTGLENVKSLGINNVNDLFTVHCKPLVLYAISKIVHEDHIIPIHDVTIRVGVGDFQEGEDYNLTRYCFEWPLDSPELFFTNSDIHSTPFPKRLLNERTYVFVDVKCYYYCDSLREEVRFRRAFNYHRHWRYNFSIEEYVDEEEIDEEEIDEKEEMEEEPYTPLLETYRQDCLLRIETKYFVSRLYAYSYLRLLRSFKENRSKKLRHVSSRDF